VPVCLACLITETVVAQESAASRAPVRRFTAWDELASSGFAFAAPSRAGPARSAADGVDYPALLCTMPQASQPGANIAGAPSAAAESTDSNTALAKQTQNPVADLISVPFQNNLGFGAGAKYSVGFRPRAVLDLLRGRSLRALGDLTPRADDDNEPQNTLNIQPVIPISLLSEWNLINRVILPVIYQPEVVPGGGDTFGLGDLQYTAFLSPSKPSPLIWGAGPVFLFPTATDDVLGTGKVSIGPSVVALFMHERWVVGALAQQLFSFCGHSDRSYVSSMLVQPFVNYNFDDGWYATTAPIITANWNTTTENQWTVPLGGGFGKVMRIGKLPVNWQVSAYYNVEKPDFAPDWTLRTQIALLFPK
jgi:hypothetical protein